jgi:hypothetical protein
MKLKFLFFAVGLAALSGCVSDNEVPEDHAPSIPKQAIDRGQTVALESNMNQIRQFVSMFRQDNDGRNPTLDELKSMKQFDRSLLINPVDGKPLIYDPATGQVYPQGGKADSKDSRASQSNTSENGAPAPPPAARPDVAPADPDAPAAPAVPAIPAIPGGAQ